MDLELPCLGAVGFMVAVLFTGFAVTAIVRDAPSSSSEESSSASRLRFFAASIREIFFVSSDSAGLLCDGVAPSPSLGE
jgi:hypothetical protein